MKSASLFFAALFLSACAGRPVAPTALPTAAGTRPAALQIAVATDTFQPGSPRVPFVIFSGTEKVADAQKVKVTAFVLTGGTTTPGWSGEAVNYSDYEVPYWVAFPELPHAGNYGLGLEITLADGTVELGQFSIAVTDDSSSPAIDDTPPASRNRTLAAEPDIHKLSSSLEPDPGLYQLTVADALASGNPTVVTFATPAFCTSKLCAPVVDSVTAVMKAVGNDRANFIHIEVYKSFDPFVYADEMDEWGLTSEPWTFVMDSSGKVAAKFGGPLSARELTAALTPLLP